MVLGQDVASNVQGTSKPADHAPKMGTRQWNIGAVMNDHWHRKHGYYIAVWEKHRTAQMRGLRSLEM